MRSTEARKATDQLPLASMDRLSHTEMKNPSHHVVPLNSSDPLTMLYGHPVVSRIALQALVDRALSGQPVVYLDGTHTFDALLIGKLARSRRQPIRKVLTMIHVARAFSARQLERLMSECLADALERYHARMAMITGLVETLSADSLTDKEINRLVDRTIESVRHLTQQGFSLLCSCPSVPLPMAPAHRLFTLLRSMSDRCIQVHELQKKIVLEDISFDTLPANSAFYEGSSVQTHPPLPIRRPVRTVHPHLRSSVG